ncbi:MAG: DUF2130 domain-containing protein [Candidatus Levybacteria bacterium]|nr:DUF2130 domain-containing protein [Candidatus Levybacteria bacterium]
MNMIVCPHCRKQVELSEAIVHQLSAKVREEEKKALQAQFEKEKAQEAVISEKKLREEFALLARNREKALSEAKHKEKELQDALVKEQKSREESEKKIRAEAVRKAEEEQRLKFKEKDLQLEQIRRVNEDLKRKIEQGSQQRQGEALELDLEEKLRSTFATDEFLPVPKGVEGGDIWQKVKFKGKTVGSILWETKRTKAWSNNWTTKLKYDAAKISSSEEILVSSVLPNGITSFDRKDGVWITTYEHAINICRFVRFLITNVAFVKSSAGQSQEEWGMVRDYLMSDAFKHRMQAHFDGIKALREFLEAEKRTTILKWKKQDAQINKLDNNTINFYGDLKAIVPNLPSVKGIDDTPLLEEGENDENDQALF